MRLPFSSRSSQSVHRTQSIALKPLPPPGPTSPEPPTLGTVNEVIESQAKEFPRQDTSIEEVTYMHSPPPLPKTSARFNAQNAEITIFSSDDTIFRLHRINVYAASRRLLQPPGFDDEDFLFLEEPAGVLEILFEFLYPDFEADFENLEFDALMRVAEAAEKYQVSYAMNYCAFWLRKHALPHSTELLRYAVKYQKQKLLADLTPALLDMDLEEVSAILPPSTFGELCIFRNKWSKALLSCYARVVDSSIEHSCSEPRITERLKSLLDDVLLKPSLLLPGQLDQTLMDLEQVLGGNRCACCKDVFEQFKNRVSERVKELPQKFLIELH